MAPSCPVQKQIASSASSAPPASSSSMVQSCPSPAFQVQSHNWALLVFLDQMWGVTKILRPNVNVRCYKELAPYQGRSHKAASCPSPPRWSASTSHPSASASHQPEQAFILDHICLSGPRCFEELVCASLLILLLFLSSDKISRQLPLPGVEWSRHLDLHHSSLCHAWTVHEVQSNPKPFDLDIVLLIDDDYGVFTLMLASSLATSALGSSLLFKSLPRLNNPWGPE